MGFGAQQMFSSDRYRQVVLADNPLMYARLDETSGTTVNDISGNARNGTYSSGGTTDWVFSQAGALKDNPNAAIKKEATAYASWTQTIFRFERTDAFSVEAWVKGASGGIIAGDISAGNDYRGWTINVTGQTTADLYIRNSYGSGAGPSVYVTMTFSNINDGNWHHLVMTYSGNSLASGLKLFVDNVEATPTVNQDNLGANTIVAANNMVVGIYASLDILPLSTDALLDELAVYGTALSSSRIGVHYNAGKNGA